MTKLEYKKQVLEVALSVLTKNANIAKLAMEDQQEQAAEYGMPRDKYDAFRNILLRKRDMHAAQYQQLLNQISFLDKVSLEGKFITPKLGAIVETDKTTLFVGEGIGKITVNNKPIFVISTRVPIFEAIKNCKIGDTYSVNGNQAKILDIY